jgi:hypothetical protein
VEDGGKNGWYGSWGDEKQRVRLTDRPKRLQAYNNHNPPLDIPSQVPTMAQGDMPGPRDRPRPCLIYTLPSQGRSRCSPNEGMGLFRARSRIHWRACRSSGAQEGRRTICMRRPCRQHPRRTSLFRVAAAAARFRSLYLEQGLREWWGRRGALTPWIINQS